MKLKVKKYQYGSASSDCILVKSANKQILLLIDDHDKNGVSLVWKGTANLSNIHEFIKSLNFFKSYKYQSWIIITDEESGDQLVETKIKKSITPFPHKEDLDVLKNKTLFVRYDIYSPKGRPLAITVSLSDRKANRESGVKASVNFYRKNFDKLVALIKDTHGHIMSENEVMMALNLLIGEYERDRKKKKPIKWLPFEGKIIDESNDIATLEATDGSGCTIKVRKGDYRKVNEKVELRLGSKLTEIKNKNDKSLG